MASKLSYAGARSNNSNHIGLIWGMILLFNILFVCSLSAQSLFNEESAFRIGAAFGTSLNIVYASNFGLYVGPTFEYHPKQRKFYLNSSIRYQNKGNAYVNLQTLLIPLDFNLHLKQTKKILLSWTIGISPERDLVHSEHSLSYRLGPKIKLANSMGSLSFHLMVANRFNSLDSSRIQVNSKFLRPTTKVNTFESGISWTFSLGKKLKK